MFSIRRERIAKWLKIPSVCMLCQQYHEKNTPICEPCQNYFELLQNQCKICALPLESSTFLLCNHCISHPKNFDKVWAPYVFQEPLRSILHSFKYKKSLFLTQFLVNLMLISLNASLEKPDCLIPVPLHPSRLKERGFNQSLELAKVLSRKLNIPFSTTIADKILKTKAQTSLEMKERSQNLKDAFLVKPHSFKHLLIVDDILTTGKTADMLAYQLKLQGALRVEVCCIARTPK